MRRLILNSRVTTGASLIGIIYNFNFKLKRLRLAFSDSGIPLIEAVEGEKRQYLFRALINVDTANCGRYYPILCIWCSVRLILIYKDSVIPDLQTEKRCNVCIGVCCLQNSLPTEMNTSRQRSLTVLFKQDSCFFFSFSMR